MKYDVLGISKVHFPPLSHLQKDEIQVKNKCLCLMVLPKFQLMLEERGKLKEVQNCLYLGHKFILF